MAVEAVKRPLSKRIYKFGRTRPVARGPHFSLRNYLLRDLPAPPATCDYSKPAAALANVHGNDTLGDCVIAGMAHVAGVLTAGATGKPFIYSNAQIIALYSAIGGYVPDDPATDKAPREDSCWKVPLLWITALARRSRIGVD
ncbi:MAG TPA: hypothetical protein VME42_07525 [Steroidobacteraceae bacterium]|nr:hypothetical protein [Steroidobacteraceae bacterium]